MVEFQSQPGFWGGAWFLFTMPLSALIFLIALFAETNRQPFDMPESEADLVGGFHTEYGAFKWSLFFVAEYSNMIVGSAVFILLFLGRLESASLDPACPVCVAGSGSPATRSSWGSSPWRSCWPRSLMMIFLFMWVRWTVPRFRYDQVMRIGWQKLLPSPSQTWSPTRSESHSCRNEPN